MDTSSIVRTHAGRKTATGRGVQENNAAGEAFKGRGEEAVRGEFYSSGLALARGGEIAETVQLKNVPGCGCLKSL